MQSLMLMAAGGENIDWSTKPVIMPASLSSALMLGFKSKLENYSTSAKKFYVYKLVIVRVYT